MKKWFCCISITALWALPQSPIIYEGEVRFSNTSEKSLEISATDRSILSWQDFSIASDEAVFFSLPAADASILNRVVEAYPSKLLGRLESNGQIILINPNGIVVGKDAQIDTGSFVASTFNVLDQPFREKQTLIYTGTTTENIEIKGCIQARTGDLVLIGHAIDQQGTLTSEKEISLISLASRHLTPGAKTLFVRAQHQIQTEENPFAAAFFHPQMDDALSFDRGFLVSGQTDLSGSLTAENITLLGDHVKLRDSAHLTSTSGKIVLGGEKNDSFMAQSTTLAPKSLVEKAKQVFVWSEQATVFHGAIHTQEKGFVEVSAKLGMDFKGDVQTYNGHLLIDPTNVTIGPGGDINTSAGPVYVYTAANVNIDNTLLTGLLATNSITIDTSANNFGQPGTLTVTGAIGQASTAAATPGWSSANFLTLISDSNMTINANILNSNGVTATGPVTLTARNGDITISAVGQALPVIVGSQFGDVTVSALRGSVFLTADNASGLSVTVGYNDPRSNVSATNGNILVEAAINCTLQGGIAPNSSWAAITREPSNIGIFPFTDNRTAVGTLGTPSNITVNVGNRLNLLAGGAFGGGNTYSEAFIGHGGFQVPAFAGPAKFGNITINVGHIMDMAGGPNDDAFVGTNNDNTGHIGDIRMNIGEYLYFHNGFPGATTAFPAAYIGGAQGGVNFQQNLFLNVGRNFTMDARGGGFTNIQIFNSVANLTTQGVQNIHIGGDFVLIAGDLFASQSNILNHFGQYTSQVWAGGNIRCYNGLAQGAVVVRQFAFTSDCGQVDVRACGNIIQGDPIDFGPGGFLTSSSGSFYFQADATFTPGQLWVPQTAIINGVNIFTGTPLGALSGNGSTVDPTVVGGDGRGGFNIDTGRYFMDTATFPTTFLGFVNTNNPAAPTAPLFNPARKVGYQTISPSRGDLIFLSADVYENGAPDDLLIAASLPNSLNVYSDFGNIRVEGFRDINLDGIDNAGQTGYYQTFFDGSITTIAQRNINLVNSHPYAAVNIDFVVDNDFPTSPLIGPGFITMDATSAFESVAGYIRIYTARQPLNSIDPAAQFISAGVPFFFIPGTLFVDTDQEKWCTYYPDGDQGVPFKIFYKDCIQLIVQQAMVVVDEFLVDLHPYNEFPGWMNRYFIEYFDADYFPAPANEPYYIRRRHLNLINHPKSYTVSLNDEMTHRTAK